MYVPERRILATFRHADKARVLAAELAPTLWRGLPPPDPGESCSGTAGEAIRSIPTVAVEAPGGRFPKGRPLFTSSSARSLPWHAKATRLYAGVCYLRRTESESPRSWMLPLRVYHPHGEAEGGGTDSAEER